MGKKSSFATDVLNAAVFGQKPNTSKKVDKTLAVTTTVLRTPLAAHIRSIKTGKVQCKHCEGVKKFTDLCAEGQEAVLIGRQVYGYQDAIIGGPKSTSLF